MASIAAATVRPARRVRGRVTLAGDKSISHRYALLAALARGTSTISHYSEGADCAATLDCLQHLGVEVSIRRDRRDGARIVEVSGRGLRTLQPPDSVLDARNSGTTIRLLSGVLAAHPFTATIGGDDSLTRRPMARVIEPLEQMGAAIDSHERRPPLTIHGADLHGITHRPEVPSAQVKSAVLLAGLQADGRTRVVEPAPTRNHTELALRAFGADVSVDGNTVEIAGGQALRAQDLDVPGDLSSAAFWLAAAAALPDSEVEIENVGLNPSRTALLDLLARAGASIETEVVRETGGEPSGRIRIRHGHRGSLTLGAADVPAVIDEIPALAAWAAQGGELHVTGAAELRLKESDRITALVRGLQGLGAEIEEFRDGFHIFHSSSGKLRGGRADAAGDHRLAMSFAIAALGAATPSVITGADSVAISYPGFFETLEKLCET